LEESTVRVKVLVPISVGRLMLAALSEMVLESADRFTNGQLVSDPVIGHTIDGC
jgi:hypothetical protein